MILQIADSLDDSDPQKPIDYEKHRQMIRAVMALRLSCKLFGQLAFPHLFRTFCLIPSLKSWLKLCDIAHLDHLGRHLETLALENHQEGSTFGYKIMMRWVSKEPRYSNIDLSLLPRLRVLKAEDKWLLTKKKKIANNNNNDSSNIRLPPGQCIIEAITFTEYQQPAVWSLLDELTEISRYGFEFTSLNCCLGINGPWLTLSYMDLSGLRQLRLSSDGVSSNRYLSNLLPDIELLQKLQHLPNLEEFYLDQYFVGREEEASSASTAVPVPAAVPAAVSAPVPAPAPSAPAPPAVNVNYTTNVLKYLQKKEWPRLRHLDLRYLTTTVADFQTFVAPHAGELARFQMHSGLVCQRGVTEEERKQRFFLPHWIRTVICPRGGGTSFEHYGGQPEGFYETPEDYDQPSVVKEGRAGDVEGGETEEEDIIMGDCDDDDDDDEDNDSEIAHFEKDVQGDTIMAYV